MSRYARDPISGSILPIAGGGGSSGHTIVNEAGTTYPARAKLKFNGAIVSDDSANDETIVDIDPTLRDAEVIEGKNLLSLESLKLIYNATVTKVYDNDRLSKITVNSTAYGEVQFSARVNTDKHPNILTPGETYIFSVGTTLLTGMMLHAGYTSPTDGTYVNVRNSSDLTGYIQFTAPAACEGMPWTIQLNVPANTTNFDVYPMLCTKEEWDKSHDYEPYYIPVKDAMFRREEQRVLGAKNWLKNNEISQVINGITWTVNADKTITANGTVASGKTNSQFSIFFTFGGNSFLFNGSPNDENCSIYIWDATTNARAKKSNGDECDNSTNNSDSEVFPVEGHDNRCVLRVVGTVSNVVFKPMIRLASDPDNTYVPYAMTNRELTKKVTTLDANTNLTSYLDSTYVESCSIFGYRKRNGVCQVDVNNIKFTSAAINQIDLKLTADGVLPKPYSYSYCVMSNVAKNNTTNDVLNLAVTTQGALLINGLNDATMQSKRYYHGTITYLVNE